MRILATGDLHLGRRSTRMGAGDGEAPLPTSAVWESIVRTAVDEEVDAVALAGDVVDRENRYFEAFGPLEKGLRSLAAAGIDTVAVAGNHDFDVLPRLADQLALDRFHLVGRGGRWEQVVLERPGGRALAVHGWSFPAEHVGEDPAAAYDLASPEGTPAVGLLHADVAGLGSRYAPVPLAGLQRLPVAAWLLGHVHLPRRLDAGPPLVLYPGSPQALDVREEGVHGPWLVELEGTRVGALRQLPLSPVRYRRLEVELGGAAGREAVESRVQAALAEALEEAAADGEGHLRLLVCHLVLAGTAPLDGDLERLADGLSQLTRSRGEAELVVDRVTVAALPAAELPELARSRDPAGALARLLLDLEAGGGPEELMEAVDRGLERVSTAAAYDGVRDDPPPAPGAVRAHLLAAGYRLLGALLAQR